jgi:hypothetical protein
VIEILKQNKVEDALIPTLAKFLSDSIKLQYKNIFIQTLATSSGKASAKHSANLEVDAETRFQLLKYVIKQTEKIKQNDSVDKSVLVAIYSSLCKSEAALLLN